MTELENDAAPDWFQHALAMEPESRWIRVLDSDIHYLRWGPQAAARPGVLFVHAGGGHAHYWSFIAPFFAQDRPVAAIELSGMGDSGRRDSYTSVVHVPEISAVAADAGLGDVPIIVGHSYGGYMAMCYGHRFGATATGVVIVDSPLRPEDAYRGAEKQGYSRPNRVFPDFESITGRWRPMPEQPPLPEYIRRHVARHAVTECEGGWTWKFDVAARGAEHFQEPLAEYLRGMACRKALIHGAESAMVTQDAAEYMATLFAPDDLIICIPDAHHHLMLDQPLAFVTALRAILSGWNA